MEDMSSWLSTYEVAEAWGVEREVAARILRKAMLVGRLDRGRKVFHPSDVALVGQVYSEPLEMARQARRAREIAAEITATQMRFLFGPDDGGEPITVEGTAPLEE